MSSIDHFVFHQANKYLLERLRSKLQIPIRKFWLEMEASGNTVSATIPIALERALAKGSIRAGDDALLAGFGAGLSWATTMVRIA
ncbi:MAG: 3-oxoacyl-[acyl-carrier-protein] synthase 3 [Pseudomonadales bacterium]|nr:3-oxoacyl-[acyl-carrier-protein] synthase 3 [Pseudomonadales bacterium]